jgi:hypothetical protein
MYEHKVLFHPVRGLEFFCKTSSRFPRGGRKTVQERPKIMAREQLAKLPSGD